MFMAVDPTLMPFDQAKPSLQVEIVPDLIHLVPAREQAWLEAGHHFGHVFVERIAVINKAIDQLLKVGLTLGAIALFRVQGISNLLDLLDLFSDHLLLGSHRVQTPVNAAGQAVELLFCGPPFFSSKFRWIDSRTSPKASAIRKPGG